MKSPNWKRLFLEARKLLDSEEMRHANGCGCRDNDDVVEGPCPGVEERVAFLKKTEQFGIEAAATKHGLKRTEYDGKVTYTKR